MKRLFCFILVAMLCVPLTADGYTFVKAADLIYYDNYEILHDGTQRKIS